MPEMGVIIMTLSVFIAGTFLWIVSKPRRLPLPPGPPPLPLLGNLFDMPQSREHEVYDKWASKYGDVVYVTAMGKHIIILTSTEAANDLLDRRAANYSDRPYIPMLHDAKLMDLEWVLTLERFSPRWKRHRRLAAQQLNPASVKRFLDKQLASTHTMLRSLVQAPSSLDNSVRYTIGDILLGIVYGFEVRPENDPHVELAERVVHQVTAGINPAKYFVNAIPWIKYLPAWFPGVNFKSFALQARKTSADMMYVPYETYKLQLAAGKVVPSLVGNTLTESNDNSDPHLLLDTLQVAASMYGAGSDTTVSPLRSCILALILNPEIQRHAQSELDEVLGSPDSDTFRLPTFSDRLYLPYIDALVKESLRWVTPVATGVPHATITEDEYRGWRIPAGSIIIPNAWSMLRNEKIYNEPSVFRPERFIATPSKPAEPDPALNGVFGFGRRVCPGHHLADSVLWIEMASLLAVFDFSHAKDKEGQDVDITYATVPDPGMILHAPSFPCSIVPRSQYTKQRVLETGS